MTQLGGAAAAEHLVRTPGTCVLRDAVVHHEFLSVVVHHEFVSIGRSIKPRVYKRPTRVYKRPTRVYIKYIKIQNI